MVQALAREATYADLEALPEGVTGQIVDGALYTHARPSLAHARASSMLGVELGGPFDRGRGGPGGWWILDEPELHLGRDVVVPDLAGWRRERLPAMPDAAHLELAPDWLCEVLSPSTVALDRVKKLALYLRERVGHVWFVDPAARTLEILSHDGARYTLTASFEGEGAVRAPPFDAVELELGTLWRA